MQAVLLKALGSAAPYRSTRTETKKIRTKTIFCNVGNFWQGMQSF